MWKGMLAVATFASLVFLASRGAAAEETVLVASQDLSIWERYSVGWNGMDMTAGVKERALVQFDLNVLPRSITIKSARLELWNLDCGDLESNCPEMRTVAGLVGIPWEEDGHNYNWEVLEDHTEGEVVGRATLPAVPRKKLGEDIGWVVWDITAAAQRWHIDPESNNGVAIRHLPYSPPRSVERRFRTKEPPDLGLPPEVPSQSPRLVVEWEAGAPPPTATPVPRNWLIHLPIAPREFYAGYPGGAR